VTGTKSSLIQSEDVAQAGYVAAAKRSQQERPDLYSVFDVTGRRVLGRQPY
jgi:hypothetical protein